MKKKIPEIIFGLIWLLGLLAAVILSVNNNWWSFVVGGITFIIGSLGMQSDYEKRISALENEMEEIHPTIN